VLEREREKGEREGRGDLFEDFPNLKSCTVQDVSREEVTLWNTVPAFLGMLTEFIKAKI
jgi:hypothetical protein